MARTKSKSGRRGGGSRKKSSSKRVGRSSASARSKTGARRKSASKRGGRKTARKTAARKRSARKSTARKSSARKSSRRTAGARARSTRNAARKPSRSSGQRGRKPRTSQTFDADAQGGEGGGSQPEGGIDGQLEGEGSYTASRHFRKAQTDFIQRNRDRLGRLGKEAEAALDGSEGDQLRGAELEARSHSAGDEE